MNFETSLYIDIFKSHNTVVSQQKSNSLSSTNFWQFCISWLLENDEGQYRRL